MQTSVDYENPQLQELPGKADRAALSGSRSWLWLGTAAALLLFSNGANTVPLAAWLAPVFMLRFVRGQILKVGLPVAYLMFVAGFAFQFRGMVPIPGVAYYIFLVVWGIPLVLPYIIDRLLSHRLSCLPASLVPQPSTSCREGRMGHGDRLHIRSTATWRYSRFSPLAVCGA